MNKIKIYAISIPICLVFVSFLFDSSHGQSSENLLPNSTKSLPIDYTNYTSDKYQIQFQYPLYWVNEEDTYRFEEGPDITISNPDDADDRIEIGFRNDFLKDYGADIQFATRLLHDAALNSYKYDFRTIESPSFVKIDNQTTGTFVVAGINKLETSQIPRTGQFWLTKAGNNGYLIFFKSTTEKFDSPENTEIRDHFIKSIKFLGVNNATGTNATNGFD